MKCLACGSEKLKLFKTIDRIEILECKKCKLALTKSGILKNTNVSEGYNLKNYLEVKKQQETKFNHIIKILNQFLSAKNSILDIGAGFGLFSSLLDKNKYDYKIEVIEPSLPLYFLKNCSKKVVIKKINYQTFLVENKKKFDCILFLDSLEHFINPADVLKKTTEILDKNGYIVINLPNYQSLMRKLCNNWSWWMVEDHKWHFSPSSIKAFLKKNNLETFHFETYENFWDFKKNLDGNFIKIKNRILRRLIKAFFIFSFFPFYFTCKKIIWYFGYGGLMLIIAKKRC